MGSTGTGSTGVASPAPGGTTAGSSAGLGRTVRLLRSFRAEQSDPGSFYALLGEDSVQQIARHCELAGRSVVDVGGGAGWFTEAFRAHGARCVLVEPDRDELHSRKTVPDGAVLGDGLRLPLRDGAADIAFSSNVLEHVPDPLRLIGEMIRVTRPGGLIYLAFTNWYSPWGGHEMSPWHYLGPAYAERRYIRRYQRKPKHKVGASLYPVHVGRVLRAMRKRGDIEIVEARPRYYPSWCRPLVAVPGVREVATWNLLLIMRRTS
jgi:SAM-dependent methyltransferase